MITPCVSICKIDTDSSSCIGYGKRMGRVEKLRKYNRG